MTTTIKKWQERMQDQGRSWRPPVDPQELCMATEIAEQKARIKQLEAEQQILVKATLAAAAKICDEHAMQELRETMDIIKADDWSEHGEIDWDSDDPDQNESHPRTLHENAAKAQAFMQMTCAKYILAIEPSTIISVAFAPAPVTV